MRIFVCVRANIVFPQIARARMVAQYGAEGRERQGAQNTRLLPSYEPTTYIMECRIASVLAYQAA